MQLYLHVKLATGSDIPHRTLPHILTSVAYQGSSTLIVLLNPDTRFKLIARRVPPF